MAPASRNTRTWASLFREPSRSPRAPVYVDGKLYTTLRGDTIVADFKQILDRYVESHYGKSTKSEELVGTH